MAIPLNDPELFPEIENTIDEILESWHGYGVHPMKVLIIRANNRKGLSDEFCHGEKPPIM